jgi:hypothetical protein
MIGPSLLPP